MGEGAQSLLAAGKHGIAVRQQQVEVELEQTPVGERPVRRDIERRLVGADRSDLARDHPAGQLIVEVECLDRPASLELVQPTTDAMHSSTNAFSLSLAPS